MAPGTCSTSPEGSVVRKGELEDRMTEVKELQSDESIRAAMQLIDQGLGDIADRSIVSTSEMADLLLDVRSLLTKLDAEVHIN